MNTIQYKNLIQEAPAQFAKLFCLLIITTALAACGGSNGSNGSSGSSGSSYSVTKISTLEELREYLYVPEAENDFLLGNAHEAGAFSQIDLTEYFDDTCPRGVLTTNIDLGGLTLNNKYNHRTSYCMRLMGDGYTISNMSVSIIETLEPWHSIQDITFLSTRRNQDLVCGTSRIYRYCLYFRNDKSSIVLLGMHRGIEDGRLRRHSIPLRPSHELLQCAPYLPVSAFLLNGRYRLQSFLL